MNASYGPFMTVPLVTVGSGSSLHLPPRVAMRIQQTLRLLGLKATVQTLGAALAGAVQSVVAKTPTAMLPLFPYLDTLRGCSSWSHSGTLQSPTTCVSMTGSGGGGGCRQPLDVKGSMLKYLHFFERS